MKNKIAPMIVLGVTALLILTVMVLYFTPISYMPNMAKPDYIQVHQTSTKHTTCDENDELYGKVLTTFNKSFSQNLLSAIFAGQTSGALNQTSIGELRTTTTAPDYVTYVQFDFNEGQKITINGHEQNVAIEEVIVEVENVVGFAETTVYFKQITSPGESTTYYYMTTLANQAELYKLIQEIQYS